MASRRRQNSLPEPGDKHIPNNMEQLAFKYMEMCKVESSTDSDSETSPRWSDTSTMGCMSSTPESGTLRRTLPLKPVARHGCYSLFLDPYDGSSEDSDESSISVSKRTRQQGQGGVGGCRVLGPGRRFPLHQPASVPLREVMEVMRDPTPGKPHPLDVPMRCGSDAELWVCELDTPPSHSDRDDCVAPAIETLTNDTAIQTHTMDMELGLDDSGLRATKLSKSHTRGPFTPVGASSSWLLDSSSERSPSPSNLQSLYKRKLGLPGADVTELGQRKKQCV